MSNAVIAQARIFEGSPEEVRNVRYFVRQLVDGCPTADDVVLLSSELATNAVLHSASGIDGTFSVHVLIEGRHVRVEVHDLGSDTAPTLHQPRQPGECGAGLRIVEEIADRWGFDGGPNGQVVWFEMGWQ
jgi:anti-sigma regulatory factor (Ser/Thr protein kinase)